MPLKGDENIYGGFRFGKARPAEEPMEIGEEAGTLFGVPVVIASKLEGHVIEIKNPDGTLAKRIVNIGILGAKEEDSDDGRDAYAEDPGE